MPVTELDAKALEMARLMVEGSEFPETIDSKIIPADWPLSIKEAALVTGIKLRQARALADSPAFIEQINKLMRARRASEKARNLSVAVQIRDDVGENLAADKTARLKAIATIEGTENRSGVTVNVQTTNNAVTVNPGYIIRLPAKRDAAIEADTRNALTLDHAPAEPDMVTLNRVGEEIE
jgi:hypothetical protein